MYQTRTNKAAHISNLKMATSLPICAIITSAALATVYSVGLYNMEPHTCSETPLFWATLSKYFMLFLVILNFLILLITAFWKNQCKKAKDFMIIILAIPNIGVLAYIVGAFISFNDRDQCPGLKTVIIIGFIVSLMACVVPCMGCLFACFCVSLLYAKLKAPRRDQSHNIHSDHPYHAAEDIERFGDSKFPL